MTARLNTYPGTCYRCGLAVPAMAGLLSRSMAGKWQVECMPLLGGRLCQPQSAKPTAAAQVGGTGGIYTLFDAVRGRLKFPAVVLLLTGDVAGPAIRLKVNGAESKWPGHLTVLANERDPAQEDRRPYLGRVTPEGAFMPSRQCVDPFTAPEVLTVLRRFAADPAQVAAEYGRLTGICCFCRLPLTDERSTFVGYGEQCASNWGLPWGARPAPLLELRCDDPTMTHGRTGGWQNGRRVA